MRATCLLRHVKSRKPFAGPIHSGKMLRALPAAARLHVPRSTRKGAIPTQQPLSGDRPSLCYRERRLQISAASPDDVESRVLPSDDPALRSISDALQNGKRPVACQGAVQLSSPIAIYGQGQTGQTFAVQLPPTNEKALQPLMDAAVPAAEFNVGSSEVRHRLDWS